MSCVLLTKRPKSQLRKPFCPSKRFKTTGQTTRRQPLNTIRSKQDKTPGIGLLYFR